MNSQIKNTIIKIRHLYIRVTNLYYELVNLTNMRLLGVKFGKCCIVHGRMYLDTGRNSSVTIGNHFCSLNGRSLNPLSRNVRGTIKVNDGGILHIGDYVGISSSVIWVHNKINIGNHVNIGANTMIMDSDAHSLSYVHRRNIKEDMQNKKDSPIKIEDDVLIGANSIILKGVTIGKRTIIGAGSVVTKSIPSDCVAAGNPCRVIKSLIEEK